MIDSSVPIVESFLAALLLDGDSPSADFRAVIRVFTTHIGFVMSTVALPAIAPAMIDSTVVSFRDARPALKAALSNATLVHSYPVDQSDAKHAYDLIRVGLLVQAHSSSRQSL